MDNFELLIKELVKLPSETTWLEFKHNNYTPETIGENISALANGAAYSDRDKSYMIWGVDDSTHEIVGTNYNQYNLKIGEQELENWLRSLLSKNCEFEFYNLKIDNKDVVLLIIYRATYQTVTFKKVDYIRVGSYTKKLMDVPSMQAGLWDRIRMAKFEDVIAIKDLTASDVLNMLEYTAYFNLKQIPIPENSKTIIHYLVQEEILLKQDNGLYSITNLGAILFAKDLKFFHQVQRKAIRLIKYNGVNKLEITKEHSGNKGYAIGFSGLMDYIEAMLPSQSLIEGALRKEKNAYPLIAIREIVANALIHQDFSITGTGPVIEIYDNRIEFTNPGIPLVDVNRIVDNPPRSRNEKLAALMRQLRMCEEAGSGWDRIVVSCELLQLPTPKIELYPDSIKVIIYNEKAFANISNEDKLWSCYMHACIKYIEGSSLTNTTLRERFGLSEKSSAPISRLIKEAIEKGLIKPIDSNTAPRHMKYIPIWA